MANPVVHFEIMGGEGKQTEEFYGQLFDWNINSDNEWGYGIVDTRTDEGIKGGVGDGVTSGNRVTLYVQVPDINEKLEEVKKLGGEVVMGRQEIPGQVVMALFKDPIGNVTGLVESPE